MATDSDDDWGRRASRVVDTLAFATRELELLIDAYRRNQQDPTQDGDDNDDVPSPRPGSDGR